MGEETTSATAVGIWRQQRVWSQAASQAKNSVSKSLLAILLLAVAGALFGALAAQLANVNAGVSRGLAFAAAVVVAAMAVARRGSGTSTIYAWIRMRSASEALKANIYLFLARAAPFSGADREVMLRERVNAIIDGVSDLEWRLLEVTPDDKELPPVHDLDSYFEQRVSLQIDKYYEPTARKLQRQLRWLDRSRVLLSLAGAVLAAAAATFRASSISPWVGVITTSAAAVTAYVVSGRFEYQMLEYSRTASALRRIRDGYLADPVGTDGGAAAQRCEEIIAAQNNAWLAKWTAPGESEPASK